MDKERERDRER
jgi:hypothetical protein